MQRLLSVLSAGAYALLILVNVGFLMAECPKTVACKNPRLSCTDRPNANGVCPGVDDYVYDDGFGGEDSATYTCEESTVEADCVWTCPCVKEATGYMIDPYRCVPDDDDDNCQLSKALIMHQVPKAG